MLLRNLHILSMDPSIGELASADILIEGERIAAIGADLTAGAETETIDCRGLLALPGLINAHLHSPANFMKGALDGSPLEIFMLYEVPPLGDTPEPPRLNYLRTMLGAIEMLKLGITTVLDDAFFNPIVTSAAIDAIMGAYRDIGMRARVALDQPTAIEYDKHPYLEEILPAAEREQMANAPRQSEPELLEIYGDFIGRWHGLENGRLGCAVSCSAPQRVSGDYLSTLTEIAKKHDLAFNIHMLETRLQRVLGDVKYGKSLVRYVDDLGALDERKLVIHAIWVDEDDTELLAQSGCSVAHNPVCNMRLGSGVMPFRKLREAGVSICLGTDEAAGDDTLSLWNVMKMTGLVHNTASPDWHTWPKAAEILDCAFPNGARALRLENQIGVLRPGALADLTLLRLDSLAFTPLNDLCRQLVYCENGSDVAKVFVAGRQVVEDRQILTIDETAIRAEILELSGQLRQQWSTTAAHATRLEPYYREMYERSLAHAVPMNRWLR
ncbi:MAG: amidohydrolase family protein [Pseudomonadota bacterium]